MDKITENPAEYVAAWIDRQRAEETSLPTSENWNWWYNITIPEDDAEAATLDRDTMERLGERLES